MDRTLPLASEELEVAEPVTPPWASDDARTFDGITDAQRKRREEGRAHRLRNQEERRATLKADIGPKSREAFIALLRRRFGSIPRAWRVHFDPGCNGKLNKAAFFEAARKVGYMDSLSTLWNELDQDKSGFISMDELDLEAHRLLSTFKGALLGRFGSMAAAWLAMDADKTGRLELREVEDVCELLGIGRDRGRAIFSWYDFDNSGFITADELDPEAARALKRGDHEHGLLNAKKATATGSFWDRTSNLSARRRAAMSRTRAQRAHDLLRCSSNARTASDFKLLLTHAYKQSSTGSELAPRVGKYCADTKNAMERRQASLPELPSYNPSKLGRRLNA